MFDKLNKHTYVNISEYYANDFGLAYRVVITNEYDIKIFGKLFHRKKVKMLPFYFKTYEIAKDFCSIMPKYRSVCVMYSGLNNSIESNRYEDYNTYRLVLDNGEEYYIIWQFYKTYREAGLSTETYEYKTTNNVVGAFAKKVNPINVFNPDIHEKLFENLSDLIKYCNDPSNEETYGYTFELVRNN